MPTDTHVIQVAVIRHGGEWRILRDGQDAGHFEYSVDAIDAALDRALRLRNKGVQVEVLVQDAAGQLRQVDPDFGDVIH